MAKASTAGIIFIIIGFLFLLIPVWGLIMSPAWLLQNLTNPMGIAALMNLAIGALFIVAGIILAKSY